MSKELVSCLHTFTLPWAGCIDALTNGSISFSNITVPQILLVWQISVNYCGIRKLTAKCDFRIKSVKTTSAMGT